MLGRASFSRELGNAINAYKGKDSMVVGLYGAWGSGKTSIINMAIDHIENTLTKKDKEKHNVIVRFNPWNYSDQNQLITQFFAQLSTKLKKSNFSDNDKDIAEKIAGLLLEYAPKYAPIVELSAADPSGFIASVLITLSAILSKRSRSSKVEDLAAIKSDLQKYLLQIPAKIIIVIDDIDRLNNTEIRQIFQLVKSLGDFHNTVYLLAFDRQVVADALAEVQKGSGNEYLEKIVQVPFEVPLADEQEIEGLLSDHLEELIEEDQRERIFSSERWFFISNGWLRSFFNNIRDVNRYINSLRFSYGPVKDEVDPVDFMAITALQVFLPEVYSSIRNNKDLFTKASGDFIYTVKKDDEKHAVNAILKKSQGSIPEHRLKDFLVYIFPRIKHMYDASTNTNLWDQMASKHSKGLICDPEAFDLYFTLCLPQGKLSRREMSGILSRASSHPAFTRELKSLVKNNKIDSFIDRLLFDYVQERDEDMANAVPEENIPNIINGLVNIGDIIPENDITSVISQSLVFATCGLLRQISYTDRYIALKQAINNGDNNLYTTAHMICCQGKIDEKAKEEDEELTLLPEQLDDLKKSACEKIQQWADDGRLARHKELELIISYWEQWGGINEAKRFATKLTGTNDGLISFITHFTRKPRNSSISDYVRSTQCNISVNSIGRYVDIKTIGVRVRNISQAKEFGNKYSDEQKWATRAFLAAISQEPHTGGTAVE